MVKEPENTILRLLREIRGEIGEVRERLDKLESGQKTIRQALMADTMMTKFVTGDFEDRIFELERKVDALTKAK